MHHVTCPDESRHTYERRCDTHTHASLTRMSHATRTNGPRQTNQKIMSRMSHVTIESCHTYERATTNK